MRCILAKLTYLQPINSNPHGFVDNGIPNEKYEISLNNLRSSQQGPLVTWILNNFG